MGRIFSAIFAVGKALGNLILRIINAILSLFGPYRIVNPEELLKSQQQNQLKVPPQEPTTVSSQEQPAVQAKAFLKLNPQNRTKFPFKYRPKKK